MTARTESDAQPTVASRGRARRPGGATRRARRRVVGSALAALALAAAAPGCSSGGDRTTGTTTSEATTTTAKATTTTEAGSGTTTTRPIAAVDPAEVPDGYRAVGGEGVGVAVAVPEGWDVVPVDPADLAATGDQLGLSDQDAQDLLAQAGGMLSDATSVAAVGPAGDGGARPAAVLVQLDLSLPTIPEVFVDQVKEQFASLGATDVTVERVPLPGLDGDARALSLRATLTSGGASTPVRMLMVPASPGIALVTVRADDATASRILATAAAG